mmetsp:Transcript_50712/g.117968  ORF Transcript_50712/g.117968 Transcript_50712/m.117968 type:complete len:261 (+) Transcript_50712:325-1107(+)
MRRQGQEEGLRLLGHHEDGVPLARLLHERPRPLREEDRQGETRAGRQVGPRVGRSCRERLHRAGHRRRRRAEVQRRVGPGRAGRRGAAGRPARPRGQLEGSRDRQGDAGVLREDSGARDPAVEVAQLPPLPAQPRRQAEHVGASAVGLRHHTLLVELVDDDTGRLARMVDLRLPRRVVAGLLLHLLARVPPALALLPRRYGEERPALLCERVGSPSPGPPEAYGGDDGVGEARPERPEGLLRVVVRVRRSLRQASPGRDR